MTNNSAPLEGTSPGADAVAGVDDGARAMPGGAVAGGAATAAVVAAPLTLGTAVLLAPSLWTRLWSVWSRHWRVYSSTLLANALPAFAEPVLFLSAIGLGLGQFIEKPMGGLPFGAFMGPGVLAMTAMFTSTFETTFGTFVRLIYQKSYDAMICTPLRPVDCFMGEALWCGTKGVAFTSVVIVVFLAFGADKGWISEVRWTVVFVPFVGFVASFLFAALGLIVTSRVKNLNNFNFYFTGVVTPMSFFSGMLFPVSELPDVLEPLAYILPLFHITEINRLLLFGPEAAVDFVWVAPLYLVVMTPLLTWLAMRVMVKRVRGG